MDYTYIHRYTNIKAGVRNNTYVYIWNDKFGINISSITQPVSD